MTSRRSGYGENDWDKNESTKSHDVGLGLRLQPYPNYVFSNSSGEGMTFTTNQRQELERQTMIYKYMMSSIPIPHELITPISKNPNLTTKGLESRYNGGNRAGIGGGKGDLEPWRCRRTDGKKWRCSRDVMSPDQKYCERHSHKGRPNKIRSRKPVESSHTVSTAPITTTATATTSTTTTNNNNNSTGLNPFQHYPCSYDMTTSIPQYNNLHNSSLIRYPEWFMKEAAVYAQQIGQLTCENRGHISNLSSGNDQTTLPKPRSFIDAWSLEDVHKVAGANLTLPTEVNSTSNCPLTLSMSGGFEPQNDQTNAKDEDNMAIRGVRSWINLPSGGPLAEALCLGMSGTNNVWGTHSDELVSPQGHSNTSTNTSMSSRGSHASDDTGGQGPKFQ